ncbi:MAG TPA: carbonic anhydrase [Bacillota bacterium]|nr:carbonic anhydrase [Bacillota bacterium]
MKDINEMLEYNQAFVENKHYERYETDSVPNKKMVVFTCMESRLVELLPKALNIQNGDVKMLKNAGAIIRKPFDSIMKSVLVAIYELKAEKVLVIGHHDCGMSHVDPAKLLDKMEDKGISKSVINNLANAGVDFQDEFHGFDTVEDSIVQSVEIIKNHPLLPDYVSVYGLVIDPGTGKVDLVTES